MNNVRSWRFEGFSLQAFSQPLHENPRVQLYLWISSRTNTWYSIGYLLYGIGTPVVFSNHERYFHTSIGTSSKHNNHRHSQITIHHVCKLDISVTFHSESTSIIEINTEMSLVCVEHILFNTCSVFETPFQLLEMKATLRLIISILPAVRISFPVYDLVTMHLLVIKSSIPFSFKCIVMQFPDLG